MNDQQWRDKLRKHFADYGQPEPEGLWEDIERGMIANRQSAPRPLSGRILYWGSRLGAAAAVIAAVIWIGSIAFRTDLPETGTTAAGTGAPEVPQSQVRLSGPAEEEPVRPNEGVSIAGNEQHLRPAPAPQAIASGGGTDHDAEPGLEPAIAGDIDIKSSADNTAEESFPESVSPPLPGKDQPSDPDKVQPAVPDKPLPATGRYGDGDLLAGTGQTRRRESGWSARLVASRIPGSGSKGVHRGYGTLNNAVMQSDYITSATLGIDAMSDIKILNKDTRTYTETRHNPPVRAGVMLSYGFTDRLSVESGLTYAYLGSRLKSGSEKSYYETRQSLHYLGIPANLNYSLWRNHLLKVYLSGGGMVEHNISGSNSTDYMDGGRTFSRKNERVRVEGLQWSVNASVGLQVDLSRRVGIFADPGVSYHFNNGSPVETVYKKNPLNFDLTFGLRISFDK